MTTEHQKEVEMQEQFVEGAKNFFGIIFAGLLWILGMAFWAIVFMALVNLAF